MAARRLTIDTAGPAEVDLMIEWAAAEGWNPGLGDAAPFHAADPQGFLIGRIDGEPVACISVVATGAAFGFLGLYICRPDFRGQGHGWALWEAGMARLAARTVGLDGVVAQQANYAKSGFVLAHRNVRYAGRVETDATTDPRIRPLDPGLLDPLAAFDTAHFGTPRDAFFRAWVAPGGDRVVRVAVVDGAIAGYGVIRPARSGFKIGPLFAADADLAEALFRALAAEAGGETLSLDPPMVNPAAVALAERHGLTPVFETARMYKGAAPALPLDRIYGITSFELG
jgi:GNAT superfamily N-acetyltransferase